MILADTSVWIDHFRLGNNRLETLLKEDQIVCHPFIIGELACGNLKNRQEIIRMLELLPQGTIAGHNEVLYFIDKHRIQGSGIGWIDAHLLASCYLTGCTIWTLDKSLSKIAKNIKISH
jgi:hypothetical protein